MQTAASILVIDDEPVLQDILKTLLTSNGFETYSAMTAAEGMQRLFEEEIDVVMLDLMLPDRNGLDLLPEILARAPDLPVIIITAHSSVESAIEAMRRGAFHYVPKPFKNEEVLHLVRRAAERRQLERENRFLRSQLEGLGEIVGTSRRIQEVFALIQRAAPARANILVAGESGTGKELAARAIHRHSPRCNKAFVPVHTSAIPDGLLESTLFGHVKGAFTGAVNSRKGLFEAAHEGTLFLDEVSTITLETQTRLLRVIQEREIRRVGSVESRSVDVRLVAASNLDLWQEVQAGRFREDLYYRLNVITIEMPPLRERAEDIPLLAFHFLQTFAEENQRKVTGFTPQAMDALTAYYWPGNVRELENAVERAVVLTQEEYIDLETLPQVIRNDERRPVVQAEVPASGLDFREAMADFQTQLIKAALKRSDNVQRRAARLLRLSPTTFNEMIHRLGINDPK
ncbi:MAG: sigma-54 dependent transcriptional regulator [Thermoanaerobaculales bacterium]|nr:sigma-54 dependent transcriptional regulator [Thermoanaerobaculales bacterium]